MILYRILAHVVNSRRSGAVHSRALLYAGLVRSSTIARLQTGEPVSPGAEAGIQRVLAGVVNTQVSVSGVIHFSNKMKAVQHRSRPLGLATGRDIHCEFLPGYVTGHIHAPFI